MYIPHEPPRRPDPEGMGLRTFSLLVWAVSVVVLAESLGIRIPAAQ